MLSSKWAQMSRTGRLVTAVVLSLSGIPVAPVTSAGEIRRLIVQMLSSPDLLRCVELNRRFGLYEKHDTDH